MASKSPPKSDQNKGLTEDERLIKRAKKCVEDFQDRESDNIRRAEEAILFRAGEQWPSAIKKDREDQTQDGGARPCPVLDKTNQYVRQVINEERQNRAAIRIRPVDDRADKETAEVFTGIIRHVEDNSNAIAAYTTAGEHAIDGGWGYWRILTEYCDDESFDQDILIKRIPNRFSVATGPHTEPDGSDMREAVIWEDLDIEVFKDTYPHAKVVDFDQTDDWNTEDTVRVAEYMYIDDTQSRVIHQLADGSVLGDAEYHAQAIGGEPMQSAKSRTVKVKTVKWCKMTSAEVLDKQDMLGTYIPVVKVIGEELVMPDGKTRLSGLIERAMDSQRLHNYSIAGFIEHVALAPRAPWIAEETQVAGYENDYSNANRKNIVLLKYKGSSSEDGHLLPAPQRTPPAGIAPGWQQMLQNTEHGIEASMGMYGPTVGAKSQEKSGIALQEQKTQGAVGNYHFPDNLARSIQHCGRILVQWIPKVYDSQRVARMLGEDGAQDMAYLDDEMETASAPRLDKFGQEVGTIYNLNVGKYDVSISTGPSYTAKRQEAAENQIQLIQARPDVFSLIGDIIMGNMDWPGADKISERLKAMLPPQIQQMEQKEGKKPPPPEVQAAMQQIEQAAAAIQQEHQVISQRQQEIQQAEQEVITKAQDLKSEKAAVDAQKAQILSDYQIQMANLAKAKSELELKASQLEAEDGSEERIKAYEADLKYQAELAKAAASIIQAEISANGSLVQSQDAQEPDKLQATMAMLHEAVQRMSAPRKTTLMFDDSGNPVGMESVLNEVMQ